MIHRGGFLDFDAEVGGEELSERSHTGGVYRRGIDEFDADGVEGGGGFFFKDFFYFRGDISDVF